MSTAKIIVFGNEARQKILNGARKLEKAVSSTLGPKGSTVVLYQGTSDFKTTKDGVSVAKSINFSDHHENIGAIIVQEAASKTNTVAGDGTTSATIFTYELMKRGNDLVNKGLNATDVKKGYELALKDVTKLLADHVYPVRNEEDIKAIASVSSNDDEEIIENVVQAFTGIGDGGVVSITDNFSRSGKTVVEFTSGLKFDRGFLSSICVNTNSESFEIENPRYILFESPIRTFDKIAHFITWAHDNKVPLIVIAPSFDNDEVIGSFYENVDKGIISGTLILTPGYSKSSIDEWNKDLSIQLSAKVIKQETDLSTIKIDEWLGKSKAIQVKKDSTIIVDPEINEELLENRIQSLKKELEDDTRTEMELTSVKERLAKMSGGIATIKIGSNSDFELREKKDRYEDAVNAVRAAIKGGISPGGGSPLIKIQHKLLKKRPSEDPAINAGYESFIRAITKPAEYIIASTGKNPWEIMAKIVSKPSEIGYNARKEKVEDLIKAGVLDPALVTVSALKYATSIAGTFVTTNTTVVPDTDNIHIQPVDEIMAGM